MEKLTVLFSDNAVFTDNTNNAYDFTRDTFALAMVYTEDYLYLGRGKPFHAVYVELATANTTANTLTVEYWDGTEWTTLTLVHENTKGFTRSGFLLWDKPSAWASNAVDSTTKYWIRIRPSASFSAGTIVQGINLVFADDVDLANIEEEIAEQLPENETSFIRKHVVIRDRIIQYLRQKYYKVQSGTGDIKDVDPWDLHDIEQVRQAAAYGALSMIFMNVSDNPEDIYSKKAEKYEKLYTSILETVQLNIDVDDDGLDSNLERFSISQGRLRR